MATALLPYYIATVIFFQQSELQISMDQINKQSLGGSSIFEENINLMRQDALACQQITEPDVFLQIQLNSCEAIINLAVKRRKEFPGIIFAVEEQPKYQSSQVLYIKIIAEVKEKALQEIGQKFRKMSLAFERRDPIDKTKSLGINLQDFFRRIVFGNSKYVFLDTRAYPEEIQQAIDKDEYLFGDTKLPIQKIGDYSYIVSNTSRQVQYSQRTNLFKEFTSLAEAYCYFSIQSTIQPNLNQLINTKLAQLQTSKQIYGTKVCLKINYRVHISVEVSFKNEELLKEFLVANYRQLSKVTFIKLSHHILISDHSFNQFKSFFQEMGRRLKNLEAELGFLEEQEVKLDDKLLQSGASHIAYSLFDQLKLNLQLGGDILCLEPYWCSQLKEQFEQAYRYWEVQKKTLQPVLNPLFSMIKHKLQKEFKINQVNAPLNLFQFAYPGITELLKIFESKIKPIGLSTSINNKKTKINILDDLLVKYIKQLVPSSNTQRDILLKFQDKENVPLKTIIADCQNYKNASSKWVDVFNCLTLGLKKSKVDQKAIARLVNQASHCRYPQLGCLGCSKFFYYNYTNLINHSKLVPIKIFPLAERITEYQTQIIQAICRMLNNSGGIILFNCLRQYRQILPIGGLLSEKDKEAIENKINYMLSFIFPKPQVTNITISFVPLAYHPLTRDLEERSYEWYKGQQEVKPNQAYSKTTYLQGRFVTRIKVSPTDTSKVYLQCSGNQYFLYGFKEKQREVTIKRLRWVVKKKIQREYKNSRLIFKDKNVECPLYHTCLTPDSGVIIDSKSLTTADPSQPKASLTLEDQYPHMSMIICKGKYLKTIKQRLQENGVRCEVEIRFIDYKFKSAINTAILYHDCRLEELVRLFRQNLDFCFEDKFVLPIYVTKYVKIEPSAKFSFDDIESASNWLKLEFPNERLRLYEYKIQRKPQYYMETNTKLSTLFIYYVFQSFGIKVTLKNPLNLDKMEEKQRKQTFQQVFVSKNNMESTEMEIMIPSDPRIKQKSSRRTLNNCNQCEEN